MADTKIRVASSRGPTDDPYTTRPTHLRMWCDDGEWFIDGLDEDGRFTEMCWSFDTFAEALASLPEFPLFAAMDKVTWDWRKQR